MKIKFKKGYCKFCGFYSEELMQMKINNNKVCVCDACVYNYGGLKDFRDAYRIGDVVFYMNN